MPRQPPRRAPPAPATPSFVQSPPVVAPPPAVTTPVFATPQGFQQDVETLPNAVPAWQIPPPQPQRRFNQPVPTMSEPLEDSDIENDPVDYRVRAIDFDALDDDVDGGEDDDEDLDEELDDEDVEGEEDENEEMRARRKSPSPLPPDLREISSLASWTVSTHKPGCGVAALRNPSPQQFWQSDGPQPHTLTLHFFKVVAIVKIRVYLDFDLDESYTPTKMMFYAGMGGNDLVHFATWEDDTPAGWVNIPLIGVGGRNKRRKSHAVGGNRRRTRNSKPAKGVSIDDGGDLYNDSLDEDDDEDDPDDPYAGNVLKAMVVQVRICENHQNGKDTHVRGFQVFAHDDDRRRIAAATAAAANAGQPGHNRRKSVQNDSQDGFGAADEGPADKRRGLDEPDWMGEPVIR
ncbi:hypothetical protein EYB26_002758 [Talaromyces marneffei]|uniref:uncharacterized protein n=1 Tax=Talaromyces marneffei TaxID=37727 RepID=UPI0012AAA38A|nr:uncharacterized protein EYB26_002758 [Talaromyces marneffei]QGA15102.1 hypothetical protein EYB26_002758 [Talaromyces marneffei]